MGGHRRHRHCPPVDDLVAVAVAGGWCRPGSRGGGGSRIRRPRRRLGSPSRVAVSAARASPGATGRRRLLRPTRLEHAAPDHSRQGRAVHRPPPQSRTRRRPSCTCRPFPPWFCDRGRQLSRPAQTSATKIIPVEPARTYHPPRTRPRKAVTCGCATAGGHAPSPRHPPVLSARDARQVPRPAKTSLTHDHHWWGVGTKSGPARPGGEALTCEKAGIRTGPSRGRRLRRPPRRGNGKVTTRGGTSTNTPPNRS